MLNSKIIILVFIWFIIEKIQSAPKDEKIDEKIDGKIDGKCKEISESSTQYWDTFDAKDKDNTKNTLYRIETVPEDKYLEAIDLFRKYIGPDSQYKGVKSREESILILTQLLKQKLSIACIKADTDEMVAVSILYLKERNLNDEKSLDQPKRPKYDKVRKYKYRERLSPEELEIMRAEVKEKLDKDGEYVMDYNIFEKYGVDKYLTSEGLVVNPDYRRRGIARRLLEVRKDICAKNNLKVTSTIFTTKASNKLAKKAGFKVNRTTRQRTILESYYLDSSHIECEIACASKKYKK